MNRYALIDPQGLVTNVIKWDGDTERWQAPEGVTLILLDEGWGFGPGDEYDFDTGEFFRPLPPEPTVDADGYMELNGVRLTDENGQWITASQYYGE